MHTPAVFLDRDGTIVEDNGDLSDPSQVVFFEDTVSSLRRLSAHFALFIVTNQSGVAKGKITMQQVDLVNAYIVSHLQRHGIRMLVSYVCPHQREDGCVCIKPTPYFIKEAALEFAINAGARAIYVLSGHGMKHRHELSKNTATAAGICEATEIILKQVKPAQNIQRSLGLRQELTCNRGCTPKDENPWERLRERLACRSNESLRSRLFTEEFPIRGAHHDG